jgi:hypothetical protein
MAEQDPNPGDTSPAAPSWTVREVQGRRSSSGKGLAAVHLMTMQNEDGTEFVIQRVDAHGAQVEMHIVGFAKPMRFDRCPICLEPDPMSKEHVPPEAIGGSVMTSTCYRCNNQAGSVWEPELVNWWEDAIGSVSFSHDEIPGRRKTSSVLIRQKGDTGEPVMVLSGRMDPAIVSKMKAGGVVEMTYSPPDRNRYRLAALRSAYLAACLLTGSIPETPEAKAIRAELIAARTYPEDSDPKSVVCAQICKYTRPKARLFPARSHSCRRCPPMGVAPSLLSP